MVLTTENNSEKVYIPKYKEFKAVLEELQKPDILTKVTNEEFFKYCKPRYVNGFRNQSYLETFGVYYSLDKGIRFLYRPTEMCCIYSKEIDYDFVPRYGIDFYIKSCGTFKTVEDNSAFVERLKNNVSSTLVKLLTSNKIAKDVSASFTRTFRGFGFIEDLYENDFRDYIKLSIEQVSRKAIKESLSLEIPETNILMANESGRYSDIIESSLKDEAKHKLLSVAGNRANIVVNDLFEALFVSGSVLGEELDEKLLDDVLGNPNADFRNRQTFGKGQKEMFGYSMDLLTEFDNFGLISQATSKNIKRIKKMVFKNNSVESLIEILNERGGTDYFVKNIIKPIAEDEESKIGVFVKRDKFCLNLIKVLEKFGVEYEAFGIKPTRKDVFEEFRQDIDKLMNEEFLNNLSKVDLKQKINIPTHTKTYLVSIMKLKHIEDKYVKVIEEKFTEKNFEKHGKFGQINTKLKDGSLYLLEQKKEVFTSFFICHILILSTYRTIL